jgi:hypothetical protein
MFVSCDNGNDGNGSPTVSINGTLTAGETLTATSSAADWLGDFFWNYADSAEGPWFMVLAGTSGENNSQFTIDGGTFYVDKHIKASRIYGTGQTALSVVGPIQAPGGGQTDTRARLIAGSGNWVKDGDPTTHFTFAAQSFGQMQMTTISFYMTGLSRVQGTCEISGNTVSAGGGDTTFTVTFTNDTTMTVAGLSGDVAAANGTYTRQ